MSELRIIPSYPDYAADSDGNIWRVVAQSRGRRWKNRTVPYMLKAAISNPGYYGVVLSQYGTLRTCRVHRLVCEAFHGKAPVGRMYVAHCDGSMTNNRPENLRWCSQKENMADCAEHGTRAFGSALPQSKLTDSAVTAMRRTPYRAGLYTHFAQMYGVSKSVIKEAYCGITWRHLPIEEDVSFLE